MKKTFYKLKLIKYKKKNVQNFIYEYESDEKYINGF